VSGTIHEEERHAYKMYIGQRAWESDTDEENIDLELRWHVTVFTATGFTPGGSSIVHIFTQTIHRTTQLTNWEKFRPCHIFASYTLAFALQLRKKHRKTSVRVVTKYSV
jgi:hypothetical protein